jgi:hypothetical protein
MMCIGAKPLPAGRIVVKSSQLRWIYTAFRVISEGY